MGSQRQFIGYTNDHERVFVVIDLGFRGAELTLAITGEVFGPGRSIMSGQCIETAENVTTPAAPWTAADVESLTSLWRRWHLNSMRAGCEHQRAEGWDERPIDPAKPTTAYGLHYDGQTRDSWNLLMWVRPDEHPGGLLGKPCSTCGYRFGSAWLVEDLPAEAVAEVRRLQALK